MKGGERGGEGWGEEENQRWKGEREGVWRQRGGIVFSLRFGRDSICNTSFNFIIHYYLVSTLRGKPD